MNEIFKSGWPSTETPCGWGSELAHTQNIRKDLSQIIKRFNIKTINDAGCGDLNWIKYVDLCGADYLGYDIIERPSWHDHDLKCKVFDISQEVMRTCDLIICRDVFIHLQNKTVLKILNLFKKSGRMLLSTSYDLSASPRTNFARPKHPTKHHSKLDLELPPFCLNPLKFAIPEDYPGKWSVLYEL